MTGRLRGDDRSAVQDALLAWYGQHRRELPWRKTRDPYAILVSEIMLQQTQVERVVPKHRAFLDRFPDFAALAAAGPGEVIRAWAPLGYNARAVRLHRIAQRVMERYGGRLPGDPESLRALEGVGEYTSAAVGCFGFGWQTPVVDTNVRRVLSRVVCGTAAPNAGEMRRLAAEMLPDGRALDWNQALMDLGAAVCAARSPRCGDCPVKAHCAAAPVLANGPAIAEERARYRTAPFKGSSRYYRGRLLQRLRAVPEGETVTLTELGQAVKPGFAVEELPWLEELVVGLERDGLVWASEDHISGARKISLP